MKTYSILSVLCLLALLSLVANLKYGTVEISWSTLLGHGSAASEQIIWQLRWPVAISAFVAGGLLALAGAILQILLRNPLADPYILGVSGGAASANLFAILFGFSSAWLHCSSLFGALIATLLVYYLARGSRIDNNRLLLSGVIVATGWGALISLLLMLSPEQNLRGMLFWLMGDVNHYTIPWFGIAVLFFATLYSYFVAPKLNVLMRGPQFAQSLGITIHVFEQQLFFVTALLTAAAVNIVGTIGFVGLIVPHILRLLHNSDHRFILPASVLLGGSFLLCANLLAQQLLSPLQLPVGLVTAIIGVPIFILLLLKK